MIKREELTNPQSCMNRAKDDEMTFVLLGRDAATPETIRFWVTERIRRGKNLSTDPQIAEALKVARELDGNNPEVGDLPRILMEEHVLAAVMEYLIAVKAPDSVSAYDLVTEIRCAMYELDRCENCNAALGFYESNVTDDDVTLCDECMAALFGSGEEDDAIATHGGRA